MTKNFGTFVAVDGVDLEVPEGSILGLIGPSGCGKTTAVRLLTGSYRPTRGVVRLLGRDPLQLSSAQKRAVGYLPQIPILFPSLTLWENLQFSASLYGMGLRRRRRRLRAVLEFAELDTHEHKRVDQVSAGMQRRLALASTLVHNPTVMFLDEPTAGIDPILRRKFWDRFRELRDEGRTFLLTTQQVAEAAYCDLVGVMSGGRLIALEAPNGLRRLAFGADFLDVVTAGRLTDAALRDISALPFAPGPAQRQEGNGIRVPVDNAADAQPQLLAWLAEHGASTESSGEFVPDYDDVFVALIERDRVEHPNAEREAV